MAFALRLTGIWLLSVLLTSCYEADFTGFVVRDEKVNRRFEASMNWNARHPARQLYADTDAYTLFLIADSHLGGTSNLEKLFRIARAEEPLAVAMLGDMCTGREADYARLVQALPPREEMMWFMLLGNHELYFDGWEAFYRHFGASIYFFTVQTPEASDLYISLDTGSGTLGSKQIQWLEEVLEQQRPNFRHCVVMTHNNLFRTPRTIVTNPPVEELHVLMDLFARHEVGIVVTGHDHRRNQNRFGQTDYLVLDALKDGLSQASYLELRLHESALSYRYVPLKEKDLP